MTHEEEKVLVIPRSAFIERGGFSGWKSLEGEEDLGIYLQGSPSRVAMFMPRGEVENNPFYLQLIPYVTIISGDRVFLYRRGEIGSESRLHGKYSIGIGGHINDTDDREPFYAFVNGVIREVREEIGIDLSMLDMQQCVKGLIYDDSTPVGQVHLGISIHINVSEVMASAIIEECEHSMLEPQWIPNYEVENPKLADQFENWSRIVAGNMTAEWSKGAKWTDMAFRERVTLLAVSASNLAASSSGFLLQESPRAHMISKAMVETSAGEVQCMLAGLIAHNDIEGHLVKKEAKKFHEDLANFVKHQKVTVKDLTIHVTETQK